MSEAPKFEAAKAIEVAASGFVKGIGFLAKCLVIGGKAIAIGAVAGGKEAVRGAEARVKERLCASTRSSLFFLPLGFRFPLLLLLCNCFFFPLKCHP